MYGGVIPEVAARSHLEAIFAGGGESAGGCSAAAAGLGRGLTKDEVDAIAVTHTHGS